MADSNRSIVPFEELRHRCSNNLAPSQYYRMLSTNLGGKHVFKLNVLVRAIYLQIVTNTKYKEENKCGLRSIPTWTPVLLISSRHPAGVQGRKPEERSPVAIRPSFTVHKPSTSCSTGLQIMDLMKRQLNPGTLRDTKLQITRNFKELPGTKRLLGAHEIRT